MISSAKAKGVGLLSAMPNLVRLIVVVSLLIAAAACERGAPSESGASAPMRIGLMLNFSSTSETVADRKRAFDLAIQHINEAGGVLGMPVEGVEADSTRDPQLGVAAARRLVETEGVHAIVGPYRQRSVIACRRDGHRPSRRADHQPLRHLSSADRGGRQRLLLPHGPFRHRPGAGAGPSDR